MPRPPDIDIERIAEQLILPDSYLDSGYAFETHPRGAAACSSRINGILRERAGSILLETYPEPFDVFDDRAGIVPPAVREAAPLLLREAAGEKSVLYNGPKVRLLDDLLLPGLEEPGAVLAVQKTDYFSSVCTNDAALRRVRLGNKVVLRELQLLSADAEEPRGGNAVLAPLGRSPCSNHIGVSTIGVTEDGRILVKTQPARAAQSAGLIAPSGSGSADFSDLQETRLLGDFLVRSMERELREECGIAKDVAIRTRVIGFARLLHRGGKPEFFGVSIIGGGKDAPRISAGEFGRMRDGDGAAFSFQMHLNLKFLEDYLDAAGPSALELFRA